MEAKLTFKTLRSMTLMISLFAFLSGAFAQNDSDFYSETINNYSSEVNLKNDYNVNGNGNNTDSERLQQAIDDVNAAGGGIIYLPQGTYLISNVIFKSNVHIKIQAGSEIQCYINGSTSAVSTFGMGGRDAYAENVSIRGVGGQYTIKTYNSAGGSRAFGMGNVNNFYIADFICEDEFSKFSCMEFTLSKLGPNYIDGRYPHNGIVENSKCLNTRYGYGFVQLQAAKNVLFRDIDGDGGATLRCESGWVTMNDLQIGGLDKIYGRNIIGRNGKCAVMISPHSMHNGIIDLDGVKSYSCSYGVTIDGGYVAPRQTNPNLTPGTFSSVIVKNIWAEFGTTAQIKAKDLNWIPYYRRDLLTGISEDFGESQIGPAIAAVRFDDHNYKNNVTVSNLVACGFACQKDIVNQDDKNHTLDCSDPDYSIGCIPDDSSSAAFTIPGSVEAENYNSMSGIQTETTSDVGGGDNVGWIGNGDWMDYEVNVTLAGIYHVDFRVASASNNITFDLKNGSTVLTSVNTATTGGWQTWKTVSTTVNLSAGSQNLRIQATGGGWNINWMKFSLSSSNTNAPAPIGSHIWLQAVNGNYVTADNGLTNTPLLSNKPTIGNSEKFEVVDAGNGFITLKANTNAMYVTVRGDLNTAPLEATANSIGDNEKFTWEDLGNNTVALLANANSKYIWCQNNVADGPIRSKGTDVASWTTFSYGTTSSNKSANLGKQDVNTATLGKQDVNTLTLYPVPMLNKINIKTDADILQVNILDMLGRSVLSANGTDASLINVSNFKQGIYIFEIITKEGRFIKKVSK